MDSIRPSCTIVPAVTLGLSLLALPLSAEAESATYTIDPDHQLVAFTVMHAGYARTFGRFGEVQGSFVYDDATQTLSDVDVSISTGSVQTFHDARDNHVRSDDFLAAEAHPFITFTADSGTPTSENTGTVTGDLTIRGVTQPVTLDVTKNLIGEYPCCHRKETIGISATTTILRSDFGSTYALPVFVGDEVEIMLEFEAIRQD
ncbi:MAG: YceI family protein [Pseudomonadota bacterium]